MKFNKSILTLLLIAGLNTGCSNTRQIGKIGCTEIYAVHGRSLDGPNFTALYESGPKGSDPRLAGFATGPGIGSAVIGAGGNVGAAAVFGRALRPSNINNNSSGANNSIRATADNVNENTANGGAGGSGTGGTGSGGFTPPGHINNPGHSN